MNKVVASLPLPVETLDPFVEAGVFDVAEIELVRAVMGLFASGNSVGGAPAELSFEEILAVAVAARAARLGHVGIELEGIDQRLVGDAALDDQPLSNDGQDPPTLHWPELSSWSEALLKSPIVHRAHPAGGFVEPVSPVLLPLVWDGTRLYLHRYFRHELNVASDLLRRSQDHHDQPISAPVKELLDRLFPPANDGQPDKQRLAVEVALTSPVSVIAGGPGTGKTRTIARLLAAALGHQSTGISAVALAAPTGKAAARMTEAVHAAVAETVKDKVIDQDTAQRVQAVEASTIHSLIGMHRTGKPQRNRHNPLAVDLVVIDETSMVALPLLARLLDAVRLGTKVVFVGDPDQLASVEAGTVLADLVGPARHNDKSVPAGALAGRVTVLSRVHRFGSESGIAALAQAVRVGDTSTAMELLASREDLQMVLPGSVQLQQITDDLVEVGRQTVDAARAGQAQEALFAASQIKVLTATHHGINGRYQWDKQIEQAVFNQVPELKRHGRWYVGRPVLITSNDRLNGVFNGDTGVAIAKEDGLAVALPATGGPDSFRLVSPAQLDVVETWWAMTIHKSQGSEFPHVVVALPTSVNSPTLTRELLYTAITRARERVTLVASPEVIAAAVSRPVTRASGLTERIWRTV